MWVGWVRLGLVCNKMLNALTCFMVHLIWALNVINIYPLPH